jgi:hypothetical protein
MARGRSGEREVECAAFANLGFQPDSPTVSLDDLFANSQTGARSFILLLVMQPAKDAKDLLVIAGIDADAVVANIEDNLFVVRCSLFVVR